MSRLRRITSALLALMVALGLASAAWWYLFDQWLGIGAVLWLTIAFFILYILDAVVRGEAMINRWKETNNDK